MNFDDFNEVSGCYNWVSALRNTFGKDTGFCGYAVQKTETDCGAIVSSKEADGTYTVSYYTARTFNPFELTHVATLKGFAKASEGLDNVRKFLNTGRVMGSI